MSEFRQQSQVLIEILAPRYFAIHRNSSYARTGRELFPWMQHLGAASSSNVDLALDHRDARSFNAAVNGEDRPCDRHPAVGGRDIEMTGFTLGSLHNNVATVELDGGVAVPHGNAKLRPFVHLNQTS